MFCREWYISFLKESGNTRRFYQFLFCRFFMTVEVVRYSWNTLMWLLIKFWNHYRSTSLQLHPSSQELLCWKRSLLPWSNYYKRWHHDQDPDISLCLEFAVWIPPGRAQWLLSLAENLELLYQQFEVGHISKHYCEVLKSKVGWVHLRLIEPTPWRALVPPSQGWPHYCEV